MNKKKQFKHEVSFGGPASSGKRSTGKHVSPNHRSVRKKDLVEVYNRFYKSQVSDLYRAVRDAR